MTDFNPEVKEGLTSVIYVTSDPLSRMAKKSLECLAKSDAEYELLLGSRKDWETASTINQLLRGARGEFILQLNDDCFIEPDTISKLKTFIAVEGVGVVGALLLYPDGRTIQHAGGRLDRTRVKGVVSFSTTHLNYGELLSEVDLRTQDVDYVTGALMMMKREVLEKVGLYDMEYTDSWEDVDLGMSVKKAGYRVIFTPEVKAIHMESATRGSNLGKTFRDSERWYIMKWEDVE